MSKFLAILEVSQKQAFIFSSSRLKVNIRNSAIIERVLSPDYIANTLSFEGYLDDKNMVYSGGGHTILEFVDRADAVKCINILSEKIYRDFDGLEVFARILPYDDARSAKENIGNLISELEKKKAVRRSAFHQGSYGLEKIDTNTLDRISKTINREAYDDIDGAIEEREKAIFPDGFETAKKFEDLGGSKNESNFIAVVHIDGNGMGKRVEDFYDEIGNADWETTRKRLRQFSEGIADDFETAYKKMVDRVSNAIKEGGDISKKLKFDKEGKHFLPIRRVITAGDDVCFVTEGRIGIECARIFIEELTSNSMVNKADKKGYSACAGVAIVHQKYPFYRAYELSEMLCSSAKKYGALISPEDNGRSISSIDWHIEFGELKDSLDNIREAYITGDGNRMELRPYIVNAPNNVMKSEDYTLKLYESFKRILLTVVSKEDGYAMGKLKNLRTALKEGEPETIYYLEYNRMKDILVESGKEKIDLSKLFTGEKNEGSIFVKGSDGVKRSILFDSIEIMDTFIAI